MIDWTCASFTKRSTSANKFKKTAHITINNNMLRDPTVHIRILLKPLIIHNISLVFLNKNAERNSELC